MPDPTTQASSLHRAAHSVSSTILLAMVVLIGAWITPVTNAQPTTPPPASEHTTPENATVVLQRTTTRIDALNLNIILPEGSVTETTSFGSNATMGVGFPDQIGVMIIKEQRTTNPDLTIAQVADNMIAQLSRIANTKTGQVLSREQHLEISPWVGERFYIRIPGLNGKPDAVRGMTIFQSQPRKFIIFDFTCLYSNFDKAKRIYETTVATMDMGNPTDIELRRSIAIKSMLKFLDSRSVEDYQNALTGKKDRWERLYLPSSTGDDMDATEFGYRKVRSWGGFKGELTDKPKDSWTADDRKLGYFVQIDAMALEDEYRIDTRATFYMSEDAHEESWTIKMSLRRDGQQRTSTITGARSGTSMAIVLNEPNENPVKTHPMIQGEGYISQVQTYLIGMMLAQDALPGEYASYAYNSSSGKITLRRDVLEKPEDTPDLIRVTTKVSAETPSNVSLYTKDGNLLRVELANGRIWEPIELERLIKLWQKKGLPLD